MQDNLNVFKAFIVGVTRVASAGYLSDLNNLAVYPAYESDYSDKFGFTEAEVNALLKHHNMSEQEGGVKAWYDGYTAGDNLHIFNPWSIISFLDKHILSAHWVNTGGATKTIELLLCQSSIHFKNNIVKLLNGEEVTASVHGDVQYTLLGDRNDDSLWSLLYYAGYLTTGKGSQTLCIPNKEVMEQWHGWVKYKVIDCLDSPSLISILLEGNVKRFTVELGEAMMSSFSYHDVGGSKSNVGGSKSTAPECFYHGFVLGLTFMGKKAGYQVDSNKEAGLGRFDIMIQPPPDRNHARAAVIELKVVRAINAMKKAAEAALEQIKSNKYRTFVARNVDEVIEYGISFFGKRVYATCRIVKRQHSGWVEGKVNHYDIDSQFSQCC